jgi:hypothetical protein
MDCSQTLGSNMVIDMQSSSSREKGGRLKNKKDKKVEAKEPNE